MIDEFKDLGFKDEELRIMNLITLPLFFDNTIEPFKEPQKETIKYTAWLMTCGTGLNAEDLPKELIEAKREHLKLKRGIAKQRKQNLITAREAKRKNRYRKRREKYLEESTRLTPSIRLFGRSPKQYKERQEYLILRKIRKKRERETQ